MSSFLKDHPFAVESFFDTSLVLTYAVHKDELRPFIPECLSLDTFENDWAFLAVAMVKTKNLRPKGFPAYLGNDFILLGYRIFVRYTTSARKRLRGLYIIRSETDKRRMAILGNTFTHYNYKYTDIAFNKTGHDLRVISHRSELDVHVLLTTGETPLPPYSPFHNWKEARRYAGPLPFTFTYDASSKEMLIIEGVREAWTPQPVEVIGASVGFIKALQLKHVALANAFVVNNVPYYWKKGRKDLWKPL